jgi:hypothetical protein
MKIDRRPRIRVRVAVPFAVALACGALPPGLAACALDFDRFDPAADASGSSPRDAPSEAFADDAAVDDAPGNAGEDAPGPTDARPSDANGDATACTASPACLTTAKMCAMTCAQQEQTCTMHCGGSSCRSTCTRTETTCTAGCATTCTSCTQSAVGCGATSDCADATR